MSSFSAEWLSLRESYDLRARNRKVLDAVATTFRSRPTVNVVDLACGTGSTVRALSAHLPARQSWDLVDNDPHLLALACSRRIANDITLNAVPIDLSQNFEAVLGGAKDLITISALLDLVSETWLDRFSGCVAAHASPVYAALTYDGRTDLSPADPLDWAISSAVNAHQLTDKGFGPALGPSAAASAITRLEALGYSVAYGNSDWIIKATDREMQLQLLAGWAAAAEETEALSRSDIDNWLARRRAAVSEGILSMRVGHVDFFAMPIATR